MSGIALEALELAAIVDRRHAVPSERMPPVMNAELAISSVSAATWCSCLKLIAITKPIFASSAVYISEVG